MNNRTAVFCFSASSIIGSGHSIRCNAFADILDETGWTIRFIVGKETISTTSHITNSSEFICSTYESISELPNIISKLDIIDLLIIDDYSVNKEIENNCRKYANKIVVIEDIPYKFHDCDVLIDQTLGREAEEYDSLLPKNTLRLVGSKYALLRKDFLNFRYKCWRKKKIAKKNKSILISYGSLDEHDLVCKTIDVINNGKLDIDINIIISSASKFIDKIKKYQTKNNNINLYIDIKNVPEIISNSDLAIGSAGLSSLERCCLGLPSLIIETSDNQKELSKSLNKSGCAHYVGKFPDINWTQISAILKNLLGDHKQLEIMSFRSMVNVDGHGTLRTVISLLPTYKTIAGDIINLRLVEFSDESQIYEWQINPNTRKYSENTAAPTPDEHHQWFMKKMNSEKCVQTIIQCNERDVGVLRFEKNTDNNNTFTVAIYLDQKEYGKGIGTQALLCGKNLFPRKNLLAKIMDKNIASKKIFVKAGFFQISPEFYKSSAI